MDMLSKPEGASIDLGSYTSDRYSMIVKYKTSYYTFVMPIRIGNDLAFSSR